MALIPPFFLDCVVAIGSERHGEINWVASGFLYGRYRSTQDPEGDETEPRKLYKVFLVTNRHVLAEQEVAILRFNPESGEPARTYPIQLVDPKAVQWWMPHPDPEVDVAVGPINTHRLKDDGISFSFFCGDDHALDRTRANGEGVSEGDGVFLLGFPMGLVGEERNYVIARGGVLARTRDWLAGASKQFLIDSGVFPGNSGGPVVLRPELAAIQGTNPTKRASLIGIVTAYVPYTDVAVSQQTGRPRVTFEENSGLGLVHSVDQIEETVDAALKAIPPTDQNVAAPSVDESD